MEEIPAPLWGAMGQNEAKIHFLFSDFVGVQETFHKIPNSKRKHKLYLGHATPALHGSTQGPTNLRWAKGIVGS